MKLQLKLLLDLVVTLYRKCNYISFTVRFWRRGENCAVSQIVVKWVRKSLVNRVANLFCRLKHLSPLSCIDNCFSHQIKLICRTLNANNDGPKAIFINLSGNLKIWIQAVIKAESIRNMIGAIACSVGIV